MQGYAPLFVFLGSPLLSERRSRRPPPRQRGPAARGEAEAVGEVPREVALVGEAGRSGDRRQGLAARDQRLRAGQPTPDLEAVW